MSLVCNLVTEEALLTRVPRGSAPLRDTDPVVVELTELRGDETFHRSDAGASLFTETAP